MSKGGEILTLQFGEYANQMGAHYWNMESQYYDNITAENPSEIDFDILFDATEERFLPRVVSFGLKGSFNEIRNYERTFSEVVPTWEGKVEKIEQEKRSLTAYQKLILDEEKEINEEEKIDKIKMEERWENTIEKLDEEAKVWADFQRIDFSSKSIFEFYQFKYSIEDSYTQRGLFSNGFGHLLSSSEDQEEVIERMRVQIEKCDKIKGVQVFTEEESFFSGICSSSLELFRDHFSRSVPIFTLSLSSSPVKSNENKINSAMALSSLSEISTMFIPIDCSNLPLNSSPLSIKKEKWFYTSAVAAVAVNSLSLPFRKLLMEKIKRLRNRKEENEMQQIANKMPTPISLLSSSFPFQTNRYLNDIYFSKNQIVNFNQSPSLLHLLRKPIFSDETEVANTMILNVRGVNDDLFLRNYSSFCTSHHKERENISSFSDLLSRSLPRLRTDIPSLSITKQPLYLPISFPHGMFPRTIDEEGNYHANNHREKFKVDSMAVMTSMQSGPILKYYLKKTAEEFANLPKHLFYNDSFNRDKCSDISNRLFSLSDGWNNSSC